ncbi:MAG: transglutaminase domain-containing protein [Candidatus Pacearchaeota archaeon]|nr:MAG: transglutaminase domain-containing protein [Candidatus Pacearchaeota archaeon]
MKRKIIFFLIFVLLFSVWFVSAEEFSPIYGELELSIKISNIIQSEAENIIVNLYLFPKETANQQVTLITEPDSEIKDDSIEFEFEETGTLKLEINAEIKREIVIKRVGKIHISGAKSPDGLEEFTESAEYVLNDDPFIKNKAQQLATTDTFETLYKLAEYVRKNMEYDPEYQEIKNASWIMQEKKGVCSHYTILFMSLARSLGLATRYVSGMAYSNKEKRCGEHAWAEVWIPGHDWVPFDPTFGQYGWLDSSHVVMMYSNDAGRASIDFRYIGEIETQSLEIETKIKKYSKKITQPIDITINPLTDKISTDSYLPLEIKVKNPHNYYLALPFRVSLAPGVFGESEKILLLKPQSEVTDYFIIYVASENYEKCQDSCIATLEVKDVFENFDNTIVIFKKGATRISLSEAQHFISLYDTEADIDFYCKVLGESYYEYENMIVECIVENREERKELSICNQNICENFTINKDEKKNITLEIPASQINESEKKDISVMKCLILCIIAKEKRDVIGVSCIDIVILDSPEIKITTLQNTEANYGSKGNLRAVIESNTQMTAEMIIETQEYMEKKEILTEKDTQVIDIPIKTWKLEIGENPVKITFRYQDKKYKEYETEKEFLFTIRDVDIFTKIIATIIHIFD